MQSQQPIQRKRFFLNWIMRTAVGYAIGFLAGFILGHFFLGNVMVGIGIGVGVGLAQWTALRSRFPRIAIWAVAPALGAAISFGLFAAAHLIWEAPFHLGWPFGVLGWAIALSVVGAFAGFIQQSVIRCNVANSTSWVIVSAVSWGLSAIGLAIPADMTGDYSGWWIALLILRNGLLAPAAAGAILGLLTGGTMLSILQGKTDSGEKDHVVEATAGN